MTQLEEFRIRFEEIRLAISVNEIDSTSPTAILTGEIAGKNINYYRRALYSELELFKMELEEYVSVNMSTQADEKVVIETVIDRGDKKNSNKSNSPSRIRSDITSPLIDRNDALSNTTSYIDGSRSSNKRSYTNTYNDVENNASTDRDRLLADSSASDGVDKYVIAISAGSPKEQNKGSPIKEHSSKEHYRKNEQPYNNSKENSSKGAKFPEHSDAAILSMIEECSSISAQFGLKFAVRKSHWYDFFDSVIRFCGVCLGLFVMAIVVAPVTIFIKPLSYFLIRRGVFTPKNHPVVIIKRAVGYALLLAAGVVVVCVGERERESESTHTADGGDEEELEGNARETTMQRVRSVNNINNLNNNNSNNDNDNNDFENYEKNKLNYTEIASNKSKQKSNSRSNSPNALKKQVNTANTKNVFSISTSISTSSEIDWPTLGRQSVMACFSHSSSLDAFIISAVLPVWNHALSKAELFLIPYFSCLLSALGGIAIDRKNRERAIRTLQRITGRGSGKSSVTKKSERKIVESELKYEKMDSENQESKVHSPMNVVPNSSVKNRKNKIISSEKSSVDCIVVAPEGTRSLTGQLITFKKGPFYLWQQMGGGGGQGEEEEGEESVEVIFEEGEKEGEDEGGEGEGCQLERVIVPVVIYGAFDLHPPPPVGSMMTMSGKVIVKFLTPIYENEVKGETFLLFRGSADRNKVVRNNIDVEKGGGGIVCGETESTRDVESGNLVGHSVGRRVIKGSVLRDRMARLVRYRMLQSMRESPLEAGRPLTWRERMYCVSVLILLLCVSAQSVRTLQYVLVTVLGLSVVTITVSMISVTLLGTVGVYFFQLIGADVFDQLTVSCR